MSRRRVSRGGTVLDIDLAGGVQLSHADFSRAYPAVLGLRAGDAVAALVKDDELGRAVEWVYEVRRGSATVVSYEQVRDFELARDARTRALGDCCLRAGAGLLLIGFPGWWLFERRRPAPAP